MPYTVLVIDDQWSMQEYTRFVLQKAGHRVLLACDSVTGLSLARTEHPDAIIMDERMHSMDMLLALRQDSHTATIPVILITLNSQEEGLFLRPGAGAFSALQKPFKPPALLTMVDRLLRETEMLIAV